MDAALNYLNRLIDQGVEYPEAHYRAFDLFGCDADALQAAYDHQFTNPNWGNQPRSYTMNKTEMIARIAEQAGLSKAQATAALQAFETGVVETLAAGEKVEMNGFGTFAVKDRPARTGRNPKTGEPIQIAASKAVTFKPSKVLSESIQ